MLLTINNGAGHTRAAEAVAAAWQKINGKIPAQVTDVSDFMSPLARFTHVTAYLWLVKNLPAVWDKIDGYQKRQTQTSPEWFYRRECRKLFDLSRKINPCAIVATEVGCCEIAALLKRDLKLAAPLVAVNLDYDADRAWIQPEVDLYTVMTEELVVDFVQNGATREKVRVWGTPLAAGFDDRKNYRTEICQRLSFNRDEKIILMSGGGEGIGQIEKSLERFLKFEDPAPQIIVLTGRNERLRARCTRLVERAHATHRAKIFGWLEHWEIPQLMRGCDLLVSKLGNTFNEAMASEIPIVALEPPPGSERVQYRLLETLGTGRAVRTIDELIKTVRELLADDAQCEQIRSNCRHHRRTDGAQKIAEWISHNFGKADFTGAKVKASIVQKEIA